MTKVLLSFSTVHYSNSEGHLDHQLNLLSCVGVILFVNSGVCHHGGPGLLAVRGICSGQSGPEKCFLQVIQFSADSISQSSVVIHILLLMLYNHSS